MNYGYINVNDTLKNYTNSQSWHRHILGMFYSDGIKGMCEIFQCYWLLNMIVNYQNELEKEEFQLWSFYKLDDGSAILICEDGYFNILRLQEIPYTDIEANEAKIWVEFNLILLPSEH